MSKEQLGLPFGKSLEFLQYVKFGGAVGKQVALAVVSILIVGLIAVASWGNINAVYVCVPAVVLLVFAGLYAVQRTLDKHPELAAMEGREYLAFKRLTNSSKGVPALPQSPATADPVRRTIDAPSAEREEL